MKTAPMVLGRTRSPPETTVLIVEDDHALRRLVRKDLERASMHVTEADSVAHAVEALRSAVFDVVILDLTLPDGSGLEVLARLREDRGSAHVIVLSGAASQSDRVLGLESGADDYVVKPFFAGELTARVRAVRRRRDATLDATIRLGALRIDVVAKRAQLDDVALELTTREFALLAFMAARPGHVFSRAELLQGVWHSNPDWQTPATVTEHVRRLRSKIEVDPARPLFLRTVRGSGYRFDAPAVAPASVEPPAGPGVIRVLDDGAEAGLDPSDDDAFDIRRGLEADEFEVYYQPVVDLDTRRTITLEALVRWSHPVRGLLAPDAFMATAERSGLIVPLGTFVLDTACRQAAAWRRDGIDTNIAVNLSARELAEPSLVARTKATVEAAGLDLNHLWLEVTETSLVEDIAQAGLRLEQLAALGVGISIDDFGTGWASLTYVREFPVHVLKIDRTFVTGIDHDANSVAIARSIISLGAELNLVVVAEGIETEAEQQILRDLGCTVGQGYLYGRPAPAGEVDLSKSNRIVPS